MAVAKDEDQSNLRAGLLLVTTFIEAVHVRRQCFGAQTLHAKIKNGRGSNTSSTTSRSYFNYLMIPVTLGIKIPVTAREKSLFASPPTPKKGLKVMPMIGTLHIFRHCV